MYGVLGIMMAVLVDYSGVLDYLNNLVMALLLGETATYIQRIMVKSFILAHPRQIGEMLIRLNKGYLSSLTINYATWDSWNMELSDARCLCQTLRSDNVLRELNWYGATDEAIIELAKVLKSNPSLQELRLRTEPVGNKGRDLTEAATRPIGKEALRALADALKYNTSLRVLDLEGNVIDCEGAKILAKALKFNRSLRELKLDRNNIGLAGADALAKVRGTNCPMTAISLQNNSASINEEQASIYSEASKNHELAGVQEDRKQSEFVSKVEQLREAREEGVIGLGL